MNKILEIKGRAGQELTGEVEGTRSYNRVAWSGNLDEEEIARPGGLLLAALIRCANERRMQLNDMARELGVTYGYVNQLRSGIRNVNQVSDDFALACARYLGVPRLTVLMLAGRITPQDVFESQEMMASEVGRAMAYIYEDPEWGHLITPEMRNTAIESQYVIVRLYEKATGKALMKGHLDPTILTGEILKLKEIQASRAKTVDENNSKKRKEVS
jgi:transcriptional regulator with XRE-family HTH domain